LNKKRADWPQQLFIKHGKLFLKILENRAESTKLEVDGLIRIFEEFKVPKRSRILDVSCGIGRHSTLLAERGYYVFGLDLSPLFVAKANAEARARKVNSRARFRVADVREIASVVRSGALLERAGWRYAKSYGEFDLTPFQADSKRIIACCLA
jgi:SAM-dependent methyltransferase